MPLHYSSMLMAPIIKIQACSNSLAFLPELCHEKQIDNLIKSFEEYLFKDLIEKWITIKHFENKNCHQLLLSGETQYQSKPELLPG